MIYVAVGHICTDQVSSLQKEQEESARERALCQLTECF